MSFRPFALPAAASTSQVMLPTSASPVSSSGSSPAPPSGQSLPPSGGPPMLHKSCREAGRVMLTDPNTGHSVCSCEYPGPGILSAYPRLHPSLLGLATGDPYGQAAAAYAAGAPATGYLAIPGDPASTAALYSSMGAPFEIKDSPEGLRTLAQTAPFYYDPGLAYPYSYNGLELSSAARRKNATRENTNTLKAWLYEHRKNPYPTKGEKIMLAIITKMTLTQVSTWFANARRRLKKENKMTWSPRSGGRDDEDDDDDDVTSDVTTQEKTQQQRDSKDLGSTGEEEDKEEEEEEDIIIDEGFEEQTCLASSRLQASLAAEALRRTSMPPTNTSLGDPPPSASPDRHSPSPRSIDEPRSPSPRLNYSPSPKITQTDILNHSNLSNTSLNSANSSNIKSGGSQRSDPPTVVIASKCSASEPTSRGPKPRIWSLADVATSASPPLGRKSPPGPPRPQMRSPWAVTATYALTQPQHHPAMHHPGFMMMPRTPLHHPLSFSVAQQHQKISPSGPLTVEDHHGTPRPRLQPSPLRSPLGEPPIKTPLDHSAPHRTATVETAFKPVHKRISTS